MFYLYGLLLVVAAAVYYIFRKVKELIRCRRLLSKFPGPKKLPILGNMMELIADDYATVFKRLRKWAQEYGPTYTISIMDYFAVHIMSAEDFETVASGMKNIEKSTVYTLLNYWLGEGLLTSSGSKWQTRRKILTPAFHFSSLQEFVRIFSEGSDELIDTLKKINVDCINVVPLVSNFTLKTVAEAAMEVKLNSVNKNDNNFVIATYKMGKLIFDRIMRPWLYIHNVYYNLSSAGYEEKKVMGVLHNYCNNIIRDKLKTQNFQTENSEKRKLSMLNILIKANKYDGIIDEQGIRDEVNTFMFEGHDTTAMSICFTMLLLAFHQDVQDTMYEEIVQVVGENHKHLTIVELNDLKYMERCIKESLRLYPSVPAISRTVDEDVKLRHGYVIPKGCIAWIDIFDIHRNPEYWDDPEKFDPDRFLPENCVNRHPFAYVPFSAGPRNCIGQKFAMLEQKAILCRILQNFKLESIDTPETVDLIQDLVLRPNNETLKLRFVPRK